MDIREKVSRWLAKANQGDTDYQILSRNRDGWTYQEEGQLGNVTSMLACIWENDSVYSYHFDGKLSVDSGEQFLAVVKNKEKNNSKLVIAVQNVGLFSFGLKDSSTEKCQALLFVRCDDWLSTIITATSDPPTVQVQHYIQDEPDSFAAILHKLFSHLVGDNSGKEVTENAGETGPSDSINLGTGAATGAEAQT